MESYINPLITYNSNVIGTVNVLEAVRITESVRVAIIVTSDKCYEVNADIKRYKESDRLGGLDPYSASKAACEIITQSYIKSFFDAEDKANISSVRAGNVIGGGDWSENRLVPDCIRDIEKGEPIRLRHPKSIRPWQHVLEPLSGYLLLGKYLFDEGNDFQGPWNFGPDNSETNSVEHIVNEIVKQMGTGKIEYEENVSDYKESNILLIDNNKAMENLKWSPRLSFKKIISMTLKEYQIQNFTLNEVFQQRLSHIKYYFNLK